MGRFGRHLESACRMPVRNSNGLRVWVKRFAAHANGADSDDSYHRASQIY